MIEINQDVKDNGWKHYINQFLGKKQQYVDVGIPQSIGLTKYTKEGKLSAIGLAHLALIQEYGRVITVTPRMRSYLKFKGLNVGTSVVIPPRPFMAQSFENNQVELESITEQLENEILTKKKTMDLALNQIGLIHVDQIKNTIRNGDFEENHPFTIEQKKSSKPLIDTGQMINSVTYEVKNG